MSVIVDALRENCSGRVVVAGDPDYDSARSVWNGMIDRRPLAVVHAADSRDVAAAIAVARDHGVLLAVRGGGHNVAGFGTCDGGIVLDLSALRQVRVDPVARTAVVGGGATWADVDRATQAHGLATPGGLVSTTGVGGLTLGGGIGWLMRAHGLTIDNLASARVVLADGTTVRANREENDDLFWAIRGGGGNFGVVTEFTFRLHPVGPIVYGGALFHGAANAAGLLLFWRDWARQLPDEITTMAAFLTAPPAPFIPPALQGTPMVAIALCGIASVEDCERLLRPLRDHAAASVDLAGPMPYVALQQMFDESAPRGICSYWKSAYLEGLPDPALDVVVDMASRMPRPFSAIHLHHLEGAVAKPDAPDTAFGQRTAGFVLNVVGMWADRSESDAHVGWVRDFAHGIEPHATGGAYVNFLGEEGSARVEAAYGAARHARLVELKRRFDPGNLFRLNQNIRPED